MERDLEISLKLLLLDANILMWNYEKKHCKQCIGTAKQRQRNCGLLRGFQKSFCSNMDSWVNRKQEKEIKKIGKLLFKVPEQSRCQIMTEIY